MDVHLNWCSYTWFIGESDDDREELLEAANYACNPSCMYPTSDFEFLLRTGCLQCVYLYVCMYSFLFLKHGHVMRFFFASADVCCSSTFWWKMEFLFASVSQEDESFLKQQVRTTVSYCSANINNPQWY